jgi:hypothetical protein
VLGLVDDREAVAGDGMITDWIDAGLPNVLGGVLVFGGLVLALAGHLEDGRRLPIAAGVAVVVIGLMVRSGTWA